MRPVIRAAMAATFGLVILLAGTTPALAKTADRNHNKIPDTWEKKYHISLKKNLAKQDTDKDGLSSLNEYLAGTNPHLKDSNHNKRADGLEDRDKDGLVNLAEVRAKTNIRLKDTDHDGVLDSAEDPDGDGLTNAQEFRIGTSLLVADSNHDGISDGDEDADMDGLSNVQEFAIGTNPLREDTDGNGVLDGDEDLDGDSLTNWEEYVVGTDPRHEDTDGNGVGDGQEDADGDGFDNQTEFEQGTDPMVADSPGDDGGVIGGPQFSGTVDGFDPETGVLSLTSDIDDQVTYEIVVDGSTTLAWGAVEEGVQPPDVDPTVDDLVEGTYIENGDTVEQPDGTLVATAITLAPDVADDPEAPADEMVAQVLAFDADTSTLTLIDTDEEGTVYDVTVDENTQIEWAEDVASEEAATEGDLIENTGVAAIDVDTQADGSLLATRLVLEPAPAD